MTTGHARAKGAWAGSSQGSRAAARRRGADLLKCLDLVVALPQEDQTDKRRGEKEGVQLRDNEGRGERVEV